MMTFLARMKIKEGKEYTRVPHMPTVSVERDFRFESRTLPRGYEHAKNHNPKNGKPQFTSQREAIECQKRAEHAGEDYIWDN